MRNVLQSVKEGDREWLRSSLRKTRSSIHDLEGLALEDLGGAFRAEEAQE